ncbi:MAG: DUF4167 domain-containing protein [Rhodospirillaceae bacterium]|nr:DUF4167 domain-containing protein [Rhodospirillaceae bacterium]
MRQNSNQRRGRGRNNQNRRPGRNQSFDSNGPSVRLRGTAAQLNEKYLALARDATSASDRVMAENYHQHADHYYRVTIALNPPQVRDEDRQPDMADSDETPLHDARPRGDRGQVQGGQVQDRRDNRNRRGRDRQEDGEEQAAAPAEAAAADRPAEAEAEPRGRGRRPSVRRQDSDPRRRSSGRADEAVPGDEPLDRGLHRILGGGPDPAAQSRERKDADAGDPARDETARDEPVGDEAAGNGAAGDPPADDPPAAAPEAAESEAGAAGEEAPKPRARRRKPVAEAEGTAAAEPVADAAV